MREKGEDRSITRHNVEVSRSQESSHSKTILSISIYEKSKKRRGGWRTLSNRDKERRRRMINHRPISHIRVQLKQKIPLNNENQLVSLLGNVLIHHEFPSQKDQEHLLIRSSGREATIPTNKRIGKERKRRQKTNITFSLNFISSRDSCPEN